VAAIDVDGQTRLASKSDDPVPVYGERILEGYRIWDPFRSKLSSLLLKSNRPGFKLDRDAKVLYLGAATGTTVSHVSDIVNQGLVYAVEFSPRAMRDLIRLCERRRNIVPILADASHPEDYAFMDVAQRNQAEIASINCLRYLKPGGDLVLMLKTRSVDVSASPQAVLSLEKEKLQGLELYDILDLLPFHKDHWAMLAKKPL